MERVLQVQRRQPHGGQVTRVLAAAEAREQNVGGETRLWTADGARYVDVTPRKGRAQD